MSRVIAIINEKGGVGKSTTSGALATGLMLAGKRTLLVDTDIQGNLTNTFGADRNKKTVMDILKGTVTAEKAIQKTEQGFIIPSSRKLAVADMELFYPDGQPATAKEKQTIPYRLKTGLEPVQKIFDYIIIDTPPTLGTITTNALTACNSVIIPCEAEQYSLDGLGQLNRTIEAVRRTTNKDIEVEGILIVRYDNRTILSRQLKETLVRAAQALDTKVFGKPIRECVALKEAHSKRRDIFRYAPRSNAAADYVALIKEILEHERQL